MSNFLYHEQNYFMRKIWVYAIMVVGALAPSIYILSLGNESLHSFISLQVLLMGVAFLFVYFSNIELKIYKEGLELAYSPLAHDFIKWQDIQQIKFKKISPLWDYGGYGVRWNWGNKKGYVVHDFGMEIIKNNGKTLFISIQNEKEVRKFIPMELIK
jgi:hypothetical protein